MPKVTSNKFDPVLYKVRNHPGPGAGEDPVHIVFNGPAKIFSSPGSFPDTDLLRSWHEKNNPHLFGDQRTEKQMFDDLIIEAIQKTDIEERELIAYEFEIGSSSLWPRVVKRGLDPAALLVASLVDAESSLVLLRDRLIYSDLLGTAAFVRNYRPSFFDKPVDNCPQPVDNSLETVDRLPETVDSSGDNPVDIFVTYPQDHQENPQDVDKSPDLSTVTKVVHSQHVDNFGPSV